MLAVLLLVLEAIHGFTLVERALGAGLGEVGVGLGEETAGLGGVLVQAGLGAIAAKLEATGRGCGVFVGGFEGTVAVPAVARAMLIPEGMVDGEDGVVLGLERRAKKAADDRQRAGLRPLRRPSGV